MSDSPIICSSFCSTEIRCIWLYSREHAIRTILDARIISSSRNKSERSPENKSTETDHTLTVDMLFLGIHIKRENDKYPSYDSRYVRKGQIMSKLLQSKDGHFQWSYWVFRILVEDLRVSVNHIQWWLNMHLSLHQNTPFLTHFIRMNGSNLNHR